MKGEAANKIKIFAIDGISYTRAWEILERSYEVKRILISRHLSLLMNMPCIEKETTSGLSKLADDTQQHPQALKALGVTVGSEVLVHIVESKLPKHRIERWEATLDRDTFPTIDSLYEFILKTAVCASRRERVKESNTGDGYEVSPSAKKRKFRPNKAFLLNVSNSCVACKGKQHPFYLCSSFKQMPVQKRIETVKNAKVCYNCLRSHRDKPCRYTSCTICHKRHNTLLHLDKYTNVKKGNASEAEMKPTASSSIASSST